MKLSCHLTQALFMRGHLPLHKKESIFNWAFQHCSVATAFGGLRKINLGRKDTSSCSSSNITNDLLRALFFLSTCTFVVLDCPQLVQGKYSIFFFFSSIFFKKVSPHCRKMMLSDSSSLFKLKRLHLNSLGYLLKWGHQRLIERLL